jgi:hypothetical protein
VKIRHFKESLAKFPDEGPLQTILAGAEAELVVLNSEIEAGRSPHFRLQSCLSRKKSADLKHEEAVQLEENCRAALEDSTEKLQAAAAAKLHCDQELAKVQLLGTAPSAPAIDLPKLMTLLGELASSFRAGPVSQTSLEQLARKFHGQLTTSIIEVPPSQEPPMDLDGSAEETEAAETAQAQASHQHAQETAKSALAALGKCKARERSRSRLRKVGGSAAAQAAKAAAEAVTLRAAQAAAQGEAEAATQHATQAAGAETPASPAANEEDGGSS